MKLVFLDTETTGLDPQRHAVIQIAGMIHNGETELERFNLLARPHKGAEVDQEALKVNGRTEKEIGYFPEPRQTHRDLVELFGKYVNKFDRRDKFHLIGYNIRFDDDFLRAFFRRCGDNYYGSWFFWPPIDVANMAALHFMEKRADFPTFKLMEVAQKAGIAIDESKAHDALYDIEVTRELFWKLNHWILKRQTFF